MMNLLGNMCRLLNNKDHKVTQQSAWLDAIEEYLRSKDPCRFRPVTSRDGSDDDKGLLLLAFACSLVGFVDSCAYTRL